MDEFERQMIPCLWIFQILGLQQFEIGGISKNKSGNGKTWKLWVHKIILFILVSIYTSFGALGKINSEDEKSIGSLIIVLLSLVGNVIYLGQAFLYIFWSFFNAKEQFNVFADLHSIFLKFKTQLNETLNYSKFKITFGVICIVAALIHVSELLLFLYTAGDLSFNNGNGFLIGTVIVMAFFVYFLNHFSGVLFVFYVEFLNFHVKALEKKISALVRSPGSPQFFYTFFNIHDTSSNNKLNERISFGHYLILLKSTYLSLWKIQKMMDKSIGPVISMFIFQLSYVLVSAGYQVFIAFISSDKKINVGFNYIIWVSAFSQLIFIVYVAEKPGDEVTENI